jgi:Cu2+-containing amine oxidase
MEREIWEIVKALDENKLTAIEAHKHLCGLYIVSGISLLNQCLKEQEEIVNSPIRFNGIHINKLKQVFLKNGIEADEFGF